MDDTTNTKSSLPHVRKILKKEYVKIQEQRDLGFILECFVYKAANNKYYRVDYDADGNGVSRANALKAMVEHQRKIKAGLHQQTSLL